MDCVGYNGEDWRGEMAVEEQGMCEMADLERNAIRSPFTTQSCGIRASLVMNHMFTDRAARRDYDFCTFVLNWSGSVKRPKEKPTLSFSSFSNSLMYKGP